MAYGLEADSEFPIHPVFSEIRNLLIPCKTVSNLETIGILRETTSGVIASGKSSVTMTVLATGVSINGVVVDSGQTVTFSAYLDPVTNIYKRVPGITYTITGTGELFIHYVD
jgi:hypothetical protein